MLNILSPIGVASAIFGLIITIFGFILQEPKNTIKENFQTIYNRLRNETNRYQANSNILERLEKMINDLDKYKLYYRNIFLFFVLGYASSAVLLAMFINANRITLAAFVIGIIASIFMTILSFIVIFWNIIKLQDMEKIIDEVIIKEKDNLIELIKRYYKPSFQFKIWRENR